MNNAEHAAAFAESYNQATYGVLQGRSKIVPCEHTRASAIGDPCEMHLFLSIKHWELAKPFSPETQARFEEGNYIENMAIQRSKDAGFEVMTPTWDELNRSWRIEEKNPDGSRRLLITGREDMRIKDPNTGELYPVEIKSMSPQVYAKINSVDDMLKSNSMYMRKYPAQLMTYLWKFEKEMGFFLLVDKVSGMSKMIPVPIDWEMMNKILDKAERIYKAVETDTIPEHCDTCNGLFCEDCEFRDYCSLAGKPSEAVINLDLDALINRIEELKPLVKESQMLNKQVKSAVGETERTLTAGYMIEMKRIHKAAYTVAEHDEYRMNIRALE